MKRIILTLVFAVVAMTAVNAQSLYKRVHDNATAVVNNAASNEQQIQINQFKITVLNYMMTQSKKRNLNKDDYFFDSQAVNLATFVTDFETNIIKARQISTEKRLAVIECYRNASLQNPLFNDTDKDATYCYVNDKQTYTPFSLDTDWEKAYDQATKNIKAILK
ncbi:MAG: hypothetical protein MJY95_05320 [Bacteroidaceae bacterium]|nr:hypothetical protein [Bacteroidaceae bacterium]